MMRGHVFVVNEDTLPIHLEYQFVGVGAGGKDSHIGLLADMLRVKEGDFIFFYIEGTTEKKGRFLGIFKAIDNTVYHLKGSNANEPNLPWYYSERTKKYEPLKLIYRKKIRPYKVYPKGVLEWVALDKLPTYSKEVIWMLIYRKMKGKRGNTMLFPWETRRLISLIREENKWGNIRSCCFTFDKGSFEIISSNRAKMHNIGNPVRLELKDIKRGESYLQAYILQNIKIGNNDFYPQIFGKNIVWIGNEVFAGSGMQKIDIMTIERLDETEYLYRIIELKHPKSKLGINLAPKQLEYYVNWARGDIGGHIPESSKYNIKPVLFYLAKHRREIPTSVVNEVKSLSSVSNSPEIYEMNLDGEVFRIL